MVQTMTNSMGLSNITQRQFLKYYVTKHGKFQFKNLVCLMLIKHIDKHININHHSLYAQCTGKRLLVLWTSLMAQCMTIKCIGFILNKTTIFSIKTYIFLLVFVLLNIYHAPRCSKMAYLLILKYYIINHEIFQFPKNGECKILNGTNTSIIWNTNNMVVALDIFRIQVFRTMY